MAMARSRLSSKIGSLFNIPSARSIVGVASHSRVAVPMTTRLGIRSKVASDTDLATSVRGSGTKTTRFSNRIKGNVKEEADRKAYILLTRYGTLSPKGKQKEEECLVNMEPRIQKNELMKHYLEEGRVGELFQIWKEEMEILYKDAEEEKKRLQAFEATLKFVVEENPTSGYTMGLNCFTADLPEERQRWMNPRSVRLPRLVLAKRGRGRKS